ncbi:MAG: sensor histidine kinase, partial [Spirosomataceae bacterium]
CFFVEVRDEGVGMTAEQMYAFKEAKTVQSTKGTHREKGTGLGLMLCKEFMQQHQGELVLKSAGKGTTVQCVFPKFGLVGREN